MTPLRVRARSMVASTLSGAESQRALLERTTEADLQRAVTDLAGYLGWEWAHFRPAQTSKGWRTPVSGPLGAGWVDLTLIRRRDRRLIFAELKAEKGRLSDRQAEVLELLRCLEQPSTSWGLTRIQVVVWRPSDLADGTIEEVLR